MNNPFLSDRNIFSKVVNPMKKKSEAEKKDEGKTLEAPSMKATTVSKESVVTNYNFYKNERPSDASSMQSGPIAAQPPPKMTFGKPNQPDKRPTFDKTLLNNPKPEMFDYASKYNDSHEESFTKVEPYRGYEKATTNNNRETYKSAGINQKNFVMESPNQEYKFEQFRKQNNFKDYSPIEQPPSNKRVNDSDFLNIDAIGDDDINRFLAESKNQEELCKILGIQRKNKPEKNPFQKEVVQRPPPRQVEIQRQFNPPAFNQPHLTSSKQNTFTKEVSYKNNIEPQSFIPYKPEPKFIDSTKQLKDHVPTFNFVSLDHENQTESRQQERVPSFNPIDSRFKGKQYAVSKSELQNDDLEVFNYSQPQKNQTENSLQQIIRKEMMQLSLNGKYRTFLTASEKIVTVKYKLQLI